MALASHRAEPMPRLSSHPQLTQGAHSQDTGTPGLRHWATRSRTCCSRGERTAFRVPARHPVLFSLRHSAGNALIPEGVLLGLSALARGFHSNSSLPPLRGVHFVSRGCVAKNSQIVSLMSACV